VNAGPLSRYAEATAQQLFERGGYIAAVLDAQPRPPAWPPRGGISKP